MAPREMATLIQMARDIYPHDHVADQYYAAAVKGFDSADSKDKIADGVSALDIAAQGRGYADYLSVPWEIERVEILRSMEQSSFSRLCVETSLRVSTTTRKCGHCSVTKVNPTRRVGTSIVALMTSRGSNHRKIWREK